MNGTALGLYCKCGEKIEGGTMLAHWAEKHPGELKNKEND